MVGVPATYRGETRLSFFFALILVSWLVAAASASHGPGAGICRRLIFVLVSARRAIMSWIDSMRGPRPGTDSTVTVANLSPIELAVIAEVNFELARAYDEAAEDSTTEAETRAGAANTARALRQRGEFFLIAAARLRSAPATPGRPAGVAPGFFYTGPERRRRGRRTRMRRIDEGAYGPAAPANRRVRHDRRQTDRRRAGFVIDARVSEAGADR